MAAASNSVDETAGKMTENTANQAESKPLLSGGEGAANGPTTDFQPKVKGIPQTRMEDGFYKSFMNPMLSRMEAHVKKNNEILDEIQAKLDKEREQRRKDDASKHIPELLKGHGQDLPKIMETLQNLIVYENYDREEHDESKFIPAKLKELTEATETTILSHSISAFVSTLEPSHLKHLANRVVNDTSNWITKLFRYEDGTAFFHEDERDGVVRVCRLAMHKKYPKLVTDGYEALYSKPPVFYINSAARPGLSQYLCAHLGLPQSCIVQVPHWKNTHKMDVTALEKLIEDDESSGKTPVMVIAYAGTPLIGHVDNLDKIKEVCKKKGDIWLHCEGNNIACLTMFRVPTEASPAKLADSMSLNLMSWLGLPALPYATIYRCSEVSLARAAGLTYFNARYKLTALPLWVCIQNLGHEGFVDRVQQAIELAKIVHESVEDIPTIYNVSKRRKPPKDPKEEEKRQGLGGMIAKAITALVVFNIENPTVVFRYQEAKKEKEGEGENEDEGENEAAERNPYYDALNIWLCETLKRDCPKVALEAIELEEYGVCIRFAPMESMHVYDTTKPDLDRLTSCLSRQLTILDATVSQRPEFQDIVEAQDNMRLVNLPNWAGLGAVQYVPEQWVDKVDNLPDHGRHEINVLNSQLVHQLKSADTAFSLGQSVDKMACVRFGLITEETDLEELIALVYTTGKEVEESSKFLETMADVVRQGIEKAQNDLEQENQNKLAQEGVLRQIPMVSSLWNWFSPPPKEAQVKGRTFNLASGAIVSTEDTYKYHMQVQEASPQLSPRPRDGPLKASLKPRHKSGSISDHPQSPTSPEPSTPAEDSAAADSAPVAAPVEAAVESAAEGGAPAAAAAPDTDTQQVPPAGAAAESQVEQAIEATESK